MLKLRRDNDSLALFVLYLRKNTQHLGV